VRSESIPSGKRLSGPGKLALALLFISPSVVAWFASSATVHQAEFPASTLWIVYEASVYLGWAGVVIVAIMTAAEAIGGRLPHLFPWVMGICVLLAVLLLCYATHIYRDPWIANT
jgi:hypothetical protein